MTDLSLVRYLGYAELPEAAPLRARLEAEQAEHLAHGVHLIAVQLRRWLAGDRRFPPLCARRPIRSREEAVDRLILDEYAAVFGHGPKSPSAGPAPMRPRRTGSC